MKKFTLLTMLFVWMGVTAFSQTDSRFSPRETGQNPAFNLLSRQAQTASKVVADSDNQLVTPPATAQVETWYTAGGKFLVNSPMGVQDFTTVMATVNVAFDGDDIYIQGLAYYFKDGWIKGTISGGTATFAGGQFVGEDE